MKYSWSSRDNTSQYPEEPCLLFRRSQNAIYIFDGDWCEAMVCAQVHMQGSTAKCECIIEGYGIMCYVRWAHVHVSALSSL